MLHTKRLLPTLNFDRQGRSVLEYATRDLRVAPAADGKQKFQNSRSADGAQLVYGEQCSIINRIIHSFAGVTNGQSSCAVALQKMP